LKIQWKNKIAKNPLFRKKLRDKLKLQKCADGQPKYAANLQRLNLKIKPTTQ
jgi:hypothetical protein